jgi:hypothetical protein
VRDGKEPKTTLADRQGRFFGMLMLSRASRKKSERPGVHPKATSSVIGCNLQATIAMPQPEEHLRALRALAHRQRLRILGALAVGEYSLGDLADLLDLREPTVARHLAILSAAALVRREPYAAGELYTLDQDTLAQLGRGSRLRPAPTTPATTSSDAYTQKVLRNFLDGERLRKIPDQRKKRQVILGWLVERFAHGRPYPEAELNAIIKAHHDDTATLRRELVAEGLLRREADVYWRI